MSPSLDNISKFGSVFPEGFYSEHPYLFFVFMSSTIYFLIGCVFAGLSCAIALHIKKEFYMLLVPVLIYLFQYYTYAIFKVHIFHIPSSVIAYNSVYNTQENFIPLVPLVVLDLLVILLYFKRRKKEIVC